MGADAFAAQGQPPAAQSSVPQVKRRWNSDLQAWELYYDQPAQPPPSWSNVQVSPVNPFRPSNFWPANPNLEDIYRGGNPVQAIAREMSYQIPFQPWIRKYFGLGDEEK